MQSIHITFPDGNQKVFDAGVSLSDIAQSISPGLRKKALAGKVNDELYDLKRPILQDASIELITPEHKEAFSILNHSTAHLMAHAIKRLYPQAKFGVGPDIEEGFYYDIDLGEEKLTESDLPQIEKMMQKIAQEGIDVTRSIMTKAEAKAYFQSDEYKQELIDAIDDEMVSVYAQHDFADLCRGVHVPNTKNIKYFKLLSVAGAYWRGNVDNKQLSRVYGTSWFSQEALQNHLNNLEERKKRDHRKLGRELELFMLSEFGPGFPFWLPKGMLLRRTLEDFWYKIHVKEGYELIQTPIMLNKDLWEISGHWQNYRENMYTSEIDKHEFAIKPMNCPGGMLVYKNQLHSYRDFPLRVGELGLVHRHEASGALAGLFRVRNFTQDDAHLFMTEAQIVDEVANLIRLFEYVYGVFGLNYHIELSTRPEDKYIGSIEIWDKSEKALADACIKMNREFKINPGDGAFYGPKLDFKLRDSMNRIWQCGTIQLDMNLPERFDLTYIDETGEKKRPVMLHRALFGSIERFIGILIEHYGGAFPTWLAPTQVKIIPVNIDTHMDFAKALKVRLMEEDIRVEVDMRDEKLGYKIRDAQTKKIPYQLVLGDKEVQANSVNARRYGSEVQETFDIEAFIDHLKKEIKTKAAL